MQNLNATKGGYVAGVIGIALAGVAFAREVGQYAGLPERVRSVEESTKALSSGQQELVRRVDLMGHDISGLRKDIERNADSLGRTLSDISTKLSKIEAIGEENRGKVIKNESDIVAAKEKASNALSLADEANRRASDLEAQRKVSK